MREIKIGHSLLGIMMAGMILSLVPTYKARAEVPIPELAGNGPSDASPEGFLFRAHQFRRGKVWSGVVDQLDFISRGGAATLSPSQYEEALFLLAEACEASDDPRAATLLACFCENYPASWRSPRARMLVADCLFFRHDWAGAAAAYAEVDNARLESQYRPLLAYRRALSLIRTGYFAEARPLVRELASYKEYRPVYDFYLAYLDYIKGNFREAYSGFRRVPEGIPGLDAGYYMAQIEYSRGDFKQAADRGRALLRGNVPAELRPELERITGLSLFKLGDTAACRPYLERYLRLAGGHPENDAVYAVGVCDYNDGDISRAAERFLSLTSDPSEVGQSAWLYLGQCRLREGDVREAGVAFGKAARMDLDRDVTRAAWYNYVTSATRAGGVPFSSASSMLEEFVERFPDSPYSADVEQYLATAYFNERNYRAALRSVESIGRPSAEVSALRQKILYELGVEALSNGRPAEAAGYLSKCVSLKKYNSALAAEAALWQGDALFSLGKYADARKAYDAFIAGASGSANLGAGYYGRGYAAYKSGLYKAAATDFARAADVKGLDERRRADATLRRADCLYYTGDYTGASSLYDEIASIHGPESDYALWRGGVVAGLAGRVSEKERLLLRLEREYPGSRWLQKGLQELAQTYETQGRAADAADVYRRRLGAGGVTDPDELMRMAETMYKAGRWEDLLDVADRLSGSGSLGAEDTADVDLWRAEALVATGRGNEGREIWKRLAGNPSALTGARAAVALGEDAIARKDYAEAEKILLDFTDAGTPHAYWLARGFILLADTYSATGRPTLAREYLETLRENYPGENDDIDSRISAALRKLGN